MASTSAAAAAPLQASFFEYKVVLLAGVGQTDTLYPLTEETPLSLLPLANRPLISFQLEMLENAGFVEVLILAPKWSGNRIREYLQSSYTGKIVVDLNEVEDHFGTAEALLSVRQKLRGDFLIIPGDLVAEPFIHHLADIHRVQDATLTALFSAIPPPAEGERPAKREAAEDEEESEGPDYVGLDANGRILFMQSESALDGEPLKIRKAVLKRSGSFSVRRNLMDAHCYILAPWVLDILRDKPHFTSIKAHLIPFLVRKQFKKPKAHATITPGAEVNTSTFTTGEGGFQSIVNRIKPNQTLALSMTASEGIAPEDVVRCYAYVSTSTYCRRANTVAEFITINKHMVVPGNLAYLPLEPINKDKYIHPSAELDQKSVGPESVVGAHTKIGLKTSIKKSNIGRNCIIGSDVKISNSIIMDGVEILEKCNINNSIICSNARIAAGCELRECKVGYGYSMGEKINGKDRVYINA